LIKAKIQVAAPTMGHVQKASLALKLTNISPS